LFGNLRRYDAKLVPWDTADASMRHATRRCGEGLKRSLRIARALARYTSHAPQGMKRSRLQLPLFSGQRVGVRGQSSLVLQRVRTPGLLKAPAHPNRINILNICLKRVPYGGLSMPVPLRRD